MLSSIHIFDWYHFLPIYTQIAYKISILWRFSNKSHLCEFVCGGTVGLFDLAITLRDIARGKGRKIFMGILCTLRVVRAQARCQNVPFGTELTWTKVLDRTLAGSTQHRLPSALKKLLWSTSVNYLGVKILEAISQRSESQGPTVTKLEVQGTTNSKRRRLFSLQEGWPK